MITASRDPDAWPSSLGAAGLAGAASLFSRSEVLGDCSGSAEDGLSDVLTAILSTNRFHTEICWYGREGRREKNVVDYIFLGCRKESYERDLACIYYYMKVNSFSGLPLGTEMTLGARGALFCPRSS